MTAKFDPDWVVAPGETLRDVFEERGIDYPQQIAALFRIPPDQLLRLFDGEEPIDTELANKLERLTNVNARMWLALEHNYRVGLAAGKKRA